ncbi:hypothetical protein QR680_015552 [Steinernema hermaphroditum]|uniref:RxLR effector protein n=1 Tax=Steinernema hermaphroditum TaxID=289476 RepID=A0AA39HAR2_9BILA|nr:hypothetical protein QR680_015552 [Steinernema hermaphroditum]
MKSTATVLIIIIVFSCAGNSATFQVQRPNTLAKDGKESERYMRPSKNIDVQREIALFQHSNFLIAV